MSLPTQIRVLKYYAVFKTTNIDLNELEKSIARVYKVPDDEDSYYIAKSGNVTYVFHTDRVEACCLANVVVSRARDILAACDLTIIRRTVSACCPSSGPAIITSVVSETIGPLTQGTRFSLHSKLAREMPRGLVLNILEPSVCPDLVVKFAVENDGNTFAVLFKFRENLSCLIVQDMRSCPKKGVPEFLTLLGDFINRVSCRG
ncbi:unknown [Feldmannia species virus]|uniref:Uncharacterized protein n=1 Tax=Feldmannia species virus TaxID=39420 RepID=B5LWD3_9PHYC|nr:hypothetical protein FeldSpV_gp044 [Feldmannia species virus]ACH46796.1 unknown [Feldmannia species virus]